MIIDAILAFAVIVLAIGVQRVSNRVEELEKKGE